ncbi:MAG: hypothetical protein ACRDSH_04490 [Pseudonocardiaceae bacterium]
MNRLFRVGILVAAALGLVVVVVPAPASADPIGGVIVIPGSGSDVDPIRLRTSTGCPAQANAFYAKMRGHGFPPDGQVVTANTKAGLSHGFGFDVYVSLVMLDYAKDNHTTLGGRYDITVYCVDRLTLHSYGEFTGSLEFANPTHYEALREAKPPGTPPAPLALAGDGSALPPDALTPPAGAQQAPHPAAPQPPVGASGNPAKDPPVPGSAGQPAPGSDSSSPSQSGELASERNEMADRDRSWPMVALAGVVIAGGSAIAVRWIRKRRLS